MKQFPADVPQQEKEAAWNKHLSQKCKGLKSCTESCRTSRDCATKDGTSYANKEAFASQLSQQLQNNPNINAMGVSSVSGIQKR